MTLAFILPAELLLLVAAAAGFVAGIAFERVRHSPARPDEAPAWRERLSEIGTVRTAAAAALGAAAIGVLFVSFGGGGRPDAPAGPPRGDAGPRPELRPRTRPVGRAFTVRAAAFRVAEAGAAAWARELASRSPGRGMRWLAVTVMVKNVDRRRFDPSRLSYRLRGRGGALYNPDRQGAVGPPGLAQKGGILPGESAQVRLGFRIPRSARRVSLTFEPVEQGSLQVRVPLTVG